MSHIICGFTIMPDLTPEEYADIKEDVPKRGVMVPIEYDENGNTLDDFNIFLCGFTNTFMPIIIVEIIMIGV